MTLYPGLIEFVKDQVSKGTPTKKIYKIAMKKFEYSNSKNAFSKYVSAVKRNYGIECDLSEEGKESLIDKFIVILEQA